MNRAVNAGNNKMGMNQAELEVTGNSANMNEEKNNKTWGCHFTAVNYKLIMKRNSESEFREGNKK